jgi:hypothetical protein
MTTVWGCSPAVGWSARNRNQAPIGGRFGSLAAPAWWRAGQTNARSVRDAVIRIGWSMRPASTSSRRSRPGKMARPAASADVHPDGRSAFERRSNTAPDPAVGEPPFQSAANSSDRTHESRSSISAWRSLPPSIGMSGPNG